jgi:integrase/recombinase XerD
VIDGCAVASFLNLALSALRFFYKVTSGREWAMEHLRYPRRANPARGGIVVLRKPEVYPAFCGVRNLKHRTLLMTLYATGMRVSEATRLRVDDIDSKRESGFAFIRGKGRKIAACLFR